MSGNYIFKLDVLEARGLGPELQALCASANFAEEGKATAYEVASDAFTFGTTLQWVVTKPKLRKMANSGTNTCKVTLLRKDGTKLGFVVLDLRTAKLQHEYKDKKGSGGRVPGR